MTIAAGATAAAEAIKERFVPGAETLEDNVRQARRAIVQGRYAAEDAVAAAALQVRRHPVTAIAVAAGAGALAGCMIGFAFGSRVRCGKSS
jgi:ElaB/YqjD/DUF883 family membrane-anchored ribosome-binding protein